MRDTFGHLFCTRGSDKTGRSFGLLWLTFFFLGLGGIGTDAQVNDSSCVTACAGRVWPCANGTVIGCNGISWYAAGAKLPSEVTLMFPPGDHMLSLEGFWWIQNLSFVSFIGSVDTADYVNHKNAAVFNQSYSRILCTNSSGIAFSNITQLQVTNLIISSCGAQLGQIDASSENTAVAVYLSSINDLTITAASIEDSDGVGIHAMQVQQFQLISTLFIRNQGAISSTYCNLNISNLTFVLNYEFSLRADRSTVYIRSSKFVSNDDGITISESKQVLLDSCIIVGTVQKRGLSLMRSSINITNSDFTNNAQGAISATDSRILFGGVVRFENNTSIDTGGAIELLYGSMMVLVAPLNISFIRNSAAAYGAAVFTSVCAQTLLDAATICFFDITDINGTLENPGIHMNFWNNTANISGSVLYGNNLDTCSLSTQSLYGGADAATIFEAICDYKEHSNSLPELASDAFNVCICEDNTPYCSIANVNYTVYPGQTIGVPLITAGQRNGSSPTPVIAYYCRPTPDEGCTQYILLGAQLPQKSCSVLNYTITDQLVNNSILLVSSFSSISRPNFYNDVNHLLINMQIQECPLGFSLETNGMYKCICDGLLRKHNVLCNIDEQTISRENGVWVGLYNGMIAVHDNCPLNYCKKELVVVNLQSTSYGSDAQCASNRSGLICGKCAEGLSVTFGSGQCEKCSNLNLFFLLLFLAAGVILVLLLFVCNLTITVGSINGLIYFANVISINSAIIFPSYGYSIYHDALSICISWINLDFGIPVCFFDGMNTYIHTWLQFTFPLYVSFLALLIIIGAKYSQMVSYYFRHNAVPVLATLLLLSFTKLLRTVITAFTATSIYISSNDDTEFVWTYDGTVRYLEPKHAILFVICLAVIIGFIAPYVLVLLFSPLLQKYSNWRALNWVNKLKPFIDAHYGPYEDRFRVWTGILLLVRIVLSFAFAVNLLNDASLNCLIIGIIQSLLLLPGLFAGRMYKSLVLNGMEIFYHANLSILAVAYLYSYTTQDNDERNRAILSGLFVGSALVALILIVLRHLWLALKKLPFFKNKSPTPEVPGISTEDLHPKLTELREYMLR